LALPEEEPSSRAESSLVGVADVGEVVVGVEVDGGEEVGGDELGGDELGGDELGGEELGGAEGAGSGLRFGCVGAGSGEGWPSADGAVSRAAAVRAVRAPMGSALNANSDPPWCSAAVLGEGTRTGQSSQRRARPAPGGGPELAACFAQLIGVGR
jgi:hypothetical protein